jgi:hypothetical protein
MRALERRTQDKQLMDIKLIRCCGLIGALIFIVLHFVTFKFGFPTYHYQSYFVRGFSDLSILLSPFSGLLGYIIGKTGAKSQNVMIAFAQGGLIAFLASLSFDIPIVIFGIESGVVKKYFFYMVFLSISLICYGSLLGGVFAIISRDYRQFHRFRLPPQFSINEILTVTTLIAVIFSSIVSIRYFVLPQY